MTKVKYRVIILCDSESISGSNDAFEHVSEIDNRPVEKGDFLEREFCPDSVEGWLKLGLHTFCLP